METPRRLQAESVPIFIEGIALVLRRWSALQTAVENEWGGRHSHQKGEELGNDILSWFTQSKETLYIDDLENILEEGMLTLNVEVDDGSVEEVAEKLMIMHEECLEGNFRSIEVLREANSKQPARPHVARVMNDDDDSDDEDGEGNCVLGDDNASNMIVDIPESESNLNTENMPANEPRPKVAAEADDGWVTVSNRRNKGRRN
ncbi:Pre-rRNA-processing protein TSR2 like [Quillaja saponaria]|uniref:Pre-rRNA-processing protein TSR2 like n=1 Tax=Quillaja saponaria TaxID=32244 RepID=A0AAD7VJG9_QUISA|nr:Pre-rRNA-processing protein TSR2 like [Quillaja saponaria]